jgi:Na+-driven multidrug efflux pump
MEYVGGDAVRLRLSPWQELLLFMLMGTSDTLMLSGVSDDAVCAVGVVNQYVFRYWPITRR